MQAKIVNQIKTQKKNSIQSTNINSLSTQETLNIDITARITLSSPPPISSQVTKNYIKKRKISSEQKKISKLLDQDQKAAEGVISSKSKDSTIYKPRESPRNGFREWINIYQDEGYDSIYWKISNGKQNIGQFYDHRHPF